MQNRFCRVHQEVCPDIVFMVIFVDVDTSFFMKLFVENLTPLFNLCLYVILKMCCSYFRYM